MGLQCLCLLLLCQDGGRILLPPDFGEERQDPLAYFSLYQEYLSLLDENPCLLPYPDVLALLDKQECGNPETGLLDLLACLEKAGHRVFHITVRHSDGKRAFVLNEKVFPTQKEAFAFILKTHCSSSKGREPVTTGKVEAYLLHDRADRNKDGIALTVSLQADRILLREVGTKDEISLPKIKLKKILVEGPLCELIMRREVLILRFVDPNDPKLRRLKDGNN